MSYPQLSQDSGQPPLQASSPYVAHNANQGPYPYRPRPQYRSFNRPRFQQQAYAYQSHPQGQNGPPPGYGQQYPSPTYQNQNQQQQQQQQQPAYGYRPQYQQQQQGSYRPQNPGKQYRPRKARQRMEPDTSTAHMQGPFYSIDVECVATGPQHTARSVAHIAMVDEKENVVLNLYVKPKEPVLSYLQPLTSLTEEMVQGGVSLEEAVSQVKAALPKNAILVGQNILKDVQWLSLEDGKDFAGMMDLAGLWRCYNQQYGNYTMHSLHHKAKALLGYNQGTDPHTADMDAILSIRLFMLYRSVERSPQSLHRARGVIMSTPVDPAFNKKYPVYEGACLGVRRTCTCGAPFFY